MFELAPNLPGWLAPSLPFRRRVFRWGAHAVHFIDHGEGPVVWLAHGNPTWSFLWRKVIAGLHGFRVIAPDLIGLGLSSKPRSSRDHTLTTHLAVQNALFDALDLREVTFVGQDWGGPIAAGIAMQHEDTVRALVFANTAVLPPRRPLRSTAFHRFSHVPLLSDAVFRLGGFPQNAVRFVQGRPLRMDRLVRRAYCWPLRRIADRAGPIGLTRMVAGFDAHPSLQPIEQIGAFVERWTGPAALVWGERDPILGRGLRRHRRALPQASVYASDAGHFLQEEVPMDFVSAIREVTPC